MIYLLVALAAFFNAVMDSMEHHSDVWPNTPFWNTRHPENDKVKRIFSYPLDGWHLAKLGMLVSLFVLITQVWWQGLILWGIWILVFNFFYNIVFK